MLIQKLLSKLSNMKITEGKLKMWFDIAKWFIGSVAIVIITTIIDAGFKDREVGLNEIKEYDKYVYLITDNNRLAERRLLAQYFSTVTPSDKLKDGWIDYFEILDSEYKQIIKDDSLAKIRAIQLKTLDSLNKKQQFELENLEQKITKYEQELNIDFTKRDYPIIKKDSISAEFWENQGFENLINENLEEAIKAFDAVENAFPSFHQAFEIRNFLIEKKRDYAKMGELDWTRIYNTMLIKYNLCLTPDLRRQMEEKIKK